MDDAQRYSLPKTEEQLGFFGFALGLVIYFVAFILLNVIPYGHIVILFFYAPFTIPFQFLMTFIYPLMWSIPFFFIRRKKTSV